MRSAGGASFSGDFMVAAKTRQGQRLEIVVVDVSGKGLDAGTRSLQLSGAFGGLLGSLPTEAFLPAANEYLMRQEWNEGFATAVHLAVNLETGVFEVRTAGHPPAVQFHAGSGRWAVHWTNGPVLGVVGAAEYSVHRGELNVGRRPAALHRRARRVAEPRYRLRDRQAARRGGTPCADGLLGRRRATGRQRQLRDRRPGAAAPLSHVAISRQRSGCRRWWLTSPTRLPSLSRTKAIHSSVPAGPMESSS